MGDIILCVGILIMNIINILFRCIFIREQPEFIFSDNIAGDKLFLHGAPPHAHQSVYKYPLTL